MSLAEFQWMFQTHLGQDYPKEGALNSFCLDADQMTKDPVILNSFWKKGQDPIKYDPYKKPTGISGSDVQKHFPPSMFEFVWLLLQSHFSQSSYDAILQLTEYPKILQVEVSNDRARDLARSVSYSPFLLPTQ